MDVKEVRPEWWEINQRRTLFELGGGEEGEKKQRFCSLCFNLFNVPEEPPETCVVEYFIQHVGFLKRSVTCNYHRQKFVTSMSNMPPLILEGIEFYLNLYILNIPAGSPVPFYQLTDIVKSVVRMHYQLAVDHVLSLRGEDRTCIAFSCCSSVDGYGLLGEACNGHKYYRLKREAHVDCDCDVCCFAPWHKAVKSSRPSPSSLESQALTTLTRSILPVEPFFSAIMSDHYDNMLLFKMATQASQRVVYETASMDMCCFTCTTIVKTGGEEGELGGGNSSMPPVGVDMTHILDILIHPDQCPSLAEIVKDKLVQCFTDKFVHWIKTNEQLQEVEGCQVERRNHDLTYFIRDLSILLSESPHWCHIFQPITAWAELMTWDGERVVV